MTEAEKLAGFVRRASYDDLSEVARRQLKIRVLDAIGCAIGALIGEPIRYLREQIIDTVAHLDEVTVKELTGLLAKVSSARKG